MKKMTTAKITVTGIVQGVGFRPFVYNTALQLNLNGTVQNDSAGVEIIVQGKDGDIDSLVKDILSNPPILAKIDSIKKEHIQTDVLFPAFSIIKSDSRKTKSTRISPDAATCPECLEELFDPQNRRYYYPYINCTHCGPRYTIIKDIPYDRKNTTMAGFVMCPACQKEYDDPTDRRFHAQPNACFECGPVYSLYNSRAQILHNGDNARKISEMIREAGSILEAGNILAVKGLGGVHLAVNAYNQEAVLKLRLRKYREKKPFAVMVKNIEQVSELCDTNREEEQRIQMTDRVIMLLKKNKNSHIAEAVAPGNHNLGVMVPYTPLQHLLFNMLDFPLVMTSGNVSDEPIAFKNDTAFRQLADIADYFLLGNRDIYIRTDDSVIRLWNKHDIPLRRARGFVPNPVVSTAEFGEPVLAVGAELKNTICLGFDHSLYMSHYIGDLKNRETYDAFIQAVSHFVKIYEKIPKIIAHDLNEQYLSTQAVKKPPQKLAWMKDCRRVVIQHHHAHIASCMAEHQLQEKVIGVAFDGTGLGPDNTIWGGEIFIADYTGFTREACLSPVLMPGGDSAVQEPWKAAFAYLWKSLGPEKEDTLHELFREVPENQIKMYLYQLKNKTGVVTTSAGRLFDAVSAIAHVCFHADYEGQPAVELEQAINAVSDESYLFPVEKSESSGLVEIVWENAIVSILNDYLAGASAGTISVKFHNGLANGIMKAVDSISAKTGIRKVVLSGGCFMNEYLLHSMVEKLSASNYLVYTHQQVPCNDGGLALGQAAIAREIHKQELEECVWLYQ
ncbi:MAG: carbamoyltransferase HypF [Spirochaetales bacterium]|nr:carbamoyltransferase HypF [Spirochaetales bacterium]